MENDVQIKAYHEIPCIEVQAQSDRNKIPDNPFELQGKLHEMLGKIYRLKIRAQNGLVVESVFTMDENATSEILKDPKGIWRKGPQTFEPFLSLVPLHMIGLEGELHKIMRNAAQRSLNDQLHSPRFIEIVTENAKKLTLILKSILHDKTHHWMGKLSDNSVLIEKLDRRIRACALDIISTAIFSKSWNSMDDYSETNPKSYALAEIMHQLNWRVVDLDQCDWRGEGNRLLGVEKYMNILDSFIEDEIDKRKTNLIYAQSCKDDMLSSWMTEMNDDHHVKLDRDRIRNLCLTFLTMGHENIATGITWTLILLSENKKFQQNCRNEVLKITNYTSNQLNSMKHITNAYHEAVRLYPSVPALTRMALEDTIICGYEIPRCTEVVLNTYLIHRIQSTWGNQSELFIPDRFDEELNKNCPGIGTIGPPDAFPFGAGTRTCIGRFLGYVESRIIISELLKEFDLSSINNSVTKPRNFVSLRPGDHVIRFTSISSSFKSKI